jgi:hypothetical protein
MLSVQYLRDWTVVDGGAFQVEHARPDKGHIPSFRGTAGSIRDIHLLADFERGAIVLVRTGGFLGTAGIGFK